MKSNKKHTFRLCGPLLLLYRVSFIVFPGQDMGVSNHVWLEKMTTAHNMGFKIGDPTKMARVSVSLPCTTYSHSKRRILKTAVPISQFKVAG